ncbi:MAG: hypothetical protein QG622_239 [Actinomycetota bacterium]|nr:hypothetical protein [Actinomycetota bacterium]
MPRRAEQAGGSDISGVVPPGFTLVRELRQDVGSSVYRVRRGATTGLGSGEYAMKILDRVPDGAGRVVAGFRREAVLLAAVDHPDLPAIHEVGELDGRPYMIMDLVEGEPLSHVIATGPLSPRRVSRLALDVLGALVAVHRHGIVHRDIRPGTILIAPDGTARLVGFGSAAPVSVDAFVYASPEQSSAVDHPVDHPVDHRSDLYSLGVVMFECLTGRPPFLSDDVGDLLRMHAVLPPPDLTELLPDTPRGLATVVATLLAKEPEDRYADGEHLIDDLCVLEADPDADLPAPGGRSVAAPARRPLAARDTELARLLTCWQQVAEGRGQACVVRGAAGVGKSRLVDEFGYRVEGLGVPVLRGLGEEDDPVPMAPLRSGTDAFLREIDQRPPAERARLRDAVRTAAGPAAGLLGTLTPRLAELLETPEAVGGQDQFVVAVAGFFTDLARALGGFVLLIDNLEWIDQATASVLERLAVQLDRVPLMVLGTVRADGLGPVASGALTALSTVAAVDIVLEPLDENGVVDLVTTFLPGMRAGRDLARMLTTRTGGNPFMVQEYLRAIVDDGLLHPAWGAWELDDVGLDRLELPKDALSLILTRIGTLQPEVRDVLVTAAAIGSRFHPELVAAVRQRSSGEVVDAVLQAVSAGLVEPWDDGGYVFLHDEVREVLQDDLDVGASRRLHQRIAEVLDGRSAPGRATGAGAGVPSPGPDPEQVYAVAHHYLAGEPSSTPDAVFEACWRAGEQALAEHAPASAVTFLEHAAEYGGERETAEFLLTLGTALREDGDFARAVTVLETAVTRTEDPFVRARIYVLLVEVYRSTWQGDEALLACERGLAELSAPLPRSAAGRVLTTAVMFLASRVTEAIGWPRRTGDARRRCELLARLHGTGGYVGILSIRPERAILHLLRALFWAVQAGPGEQYARSQAGYGYIAYQVGLRRLGRRIFARAAADPSTARPDVAALIAHYRGAAACLSYADDGADWRESIERQGRWLDTGAFNEATGAFLLESAFEGRTAEAARWLAVAGDRATLRPGEPSVLISGPAIVAAMEGRPSDAMDALRLLERGMDGLPSFGYRLITALTQLTVLVEQQETGERFDRAVLELEELGVPMRIVVRQQRNILFRIAMGRLAQCRAAAPGELPERLATARLAIQALRPAARRPRLRAWESVARADLAVLENRPGQALDLLGDVPLALVPDAPLLAYEVARVRARASAAIGASSEARRQAHLALGIAEEAGWNHRVSWVMKEFGILSRKGRSRVSVPPAPAPGTTTAPGPAGAPGRTGAPPVLDDLPCGERLDALLEVMTAVTEVIDPALLSRLVLDETLRLLGADRAFLFLPGCPDSFGDLVPVLGRNAAGEDVDDPGGHVASLVDRVRITREPLVVSRVGEGIAPGSRETLLPGVRSVVVVPLEHEGRLLGVVHLDKPVTEGIFDTGDVGLLRILADHFAVSFDTARSVQSEFAVRSVRQQRDLAERLRRALAETASALEPDGVLASLLTSARTAVPCDHAWLLTGEPDGSCHLLAVEEPGGLVRTEIVPDPAARELLGLDRPVNGASVTVPQSLFTELTSASSWIAVPLPGDPQRRGTLVLAATSADVVLADAVEVAAVLVIQAMTAYDRAVVSALLGGTTARP